MIKPNLVYAKDIKLEGGRGPRNAADLPYGMWVCADGAAYLFNRDYEPIWVKRPGSATEKANRGQWVKFVLEMHFWDDSCNPKRDRGMALAMRLIRDNFVQSKP